MNSFQNQISVLDYGAGNIGSVLRALRAVEAPYQVISTPHEVAQASALIFPGVGSAEQAMRSLMASGNSLALKSFAASGKPLLGICVGMQVLGEKSEEGDVDCLGLLPYRLVKFNISEPVPHMGWNDLQFNLNHPLSSDFLSAFPSAPDCYFVHSYYAPLVKNETMPDYVLASTEYADVRFASFVAHKNVWGMQFHVEKSGDTGLSFIKSFCQRNT